MFDLSQRDFFRSSVLLGERYTVLIYFNELDQG